MKFFPILKVDICFELWLTCFGTRMRRMPGIFCMRIVRTQLGILWVLGFLEQNFNVN